jgi:hypothetical protein
LGGLSGFGRSATVVAADRLRSSYASSVCLAISRAALPKTKAEGGEASAYRYATIYAQWDNRAKAIEWLEATLRLRDPGVT